MHEQTIAKAIIQEATKHGQVVGITVEVGDLGHLPAREVEQVLKSLTEWNIKILKKKATVKCEVCGYKGTPEIIEKGHDHNVFKCPKCKAMMPRIIDGDKIILIDVEVED
ncbi:MAG: hydrogenase maturation nickel metallochaperone HypA [Nanoarchaeota archaeon]|nr:hydrogenase maturation nickel metallochaperone HypA [Nanoarchaeota archaeon]MBU1270079.1 hydrogenase maturation nickel metallochaperone HypA [Nanoarchaeota archaeon]MBU1604992.1 hydrogenase maturation nickel metallochaperone HypA [Nanoarchaeota archaeon]MBU2443415.1 hydrogenase maturation nickel metallochaperone HypA [Nanoarchaeota archaeon]